MQTYVSEKAEELLCKEYYKSSLKTKDLSSIIGVSESKIYQDFSSLGEEFILENDLYPRWIKTGRTRKWRIETIIDWMKRQEGKNV